MSCIKTGHFIFVINCILGKCKISVSTRSHLYLEKNCEEQNRNVCRFTFNQHGEFTRAGC